MAEDKLNQPRPSQKKENMIAQGSDGFMDNQTNGSTKVGTHTPGTHARSQTVTENSSGNRGGEGSKQMHEDRKNPEKDHVPGHMGYSMADVQGVTPAGARRDDQDDNASDNSSNNLSDDFSGDQLYDKLDRH